MKSLLLSLKPNATGADRGAARDGAREQQEMGVWVQHRHAGEGRSGRVAACSKRPYAAASEKTSDFFADTEAKCGHALKQ